MNLELKDLVTIAVLIFLEGMLSIDNAVVLALLARKLPQRDQRKALTYGIVGAITFRLIAIALAVSLLHWFWIKIIGALYLFYVGLKFFWRASRKADSAEEDPHRRRSSKDFWKTVAMIELTDIAFAIDSILAAVAVSQKYWVVVIAGSLGILLMRFAASLFIALLRRFPSFEISAYLMVLVIAAKLALEVIFRNQLDFESHHRMEFWMFWFGILICFFIGFFRLPRSHTAK